MEKGDNTAFYNASSSDVALDQIDPQLEANMDMSGEGEQGDTGLADQQQLDGGPDASQDVVEESYPESHLRALKAEDTGQAAAVAAAAAAAAYAEVQQQQQQDDSNASYLDQPQQEQDEAQQQAGGNRVSVEELQLAAQLSQGLAPIMHEDNARRQEEEFQQQQDQHQQQSQQGQAQQDQQQGQHQHHQIGADGTTGLPGEESAYGADPEAAAAAAYHHVLQQQADVQGQAAAAAAAAYVDASQAVAHMSSSLQMAQHMAAQQAAYSNVDHIPPRKRSKVSRACDACRRKKIKCDSLSETEQCSNCRRYKIPCLFSRVPQKRGPSKGYIKELADRINSIEGKLGHQTPSAADAALGDPAADAYQANAFAALNESNKRPFASISSDTTPQESPSGATTAAVPGSSGGGRHAAWGSTPRAAPAQATPPATARPLFSAAQLAPRPVVNSDTSALRIALLEEEILLAAVTNVDYTAQGFSDPAFAWYISSVHPALPFLASTKERSLELLSQCPPLLQCAFVIALKAAASAFEVVTEDSGHGESAALAAGLLHRWDWDDGGELTPVTNLVHMQTLLLLAVEADTHGPVSIRGQRRGLSKTTVLARAISLAYAMELPTKQVDDLLPLGTVLHFAQSGADADANIAENGTGSSVVESFDSDARLALRCWWSLVSLDRWNATGTGQQLQIPPRTVVRTANLASLVGDVPFRFISLACLLGDSHDALVSGPGTNTRFLAQMLNGSLESWQTSVLPPLTPDTNPALYLAYWTVRLLYHLETPSVLAIEPLEVAKSLLELLAAGPSTFNGPLLHYALVLPVLVLAKLAAAAGKERDISDTPAQALKVLNDLVLGPEAAIPASSSVCASWLGPLRETATDILASNTDGTDPTGGAAGVAAAAATQGLQHLADLATATVASTTGNEEGAVVGGEAAGAEDGSVGAGAAQSWLRLLKPDNYVYLGFNPQALLQGGFLTAVKPSERPVDVTA